MTRRKLTVVLFVAVLLVVSSAGRGVSHPLGNFTINHYTGIEVRSDSMILHYVIDMAEIPTFQEMQREGIKSEEDLFRSRYPDKMVEKLKRGLFLKVNGERVPLSTDGTGRISFPPGVGGLITMRIEVDFIARFVPDYHSTRNDAQYDDMNFEGRAGWKEIDVYRTDNTVLLGSSANAANLSHRLLAYPQNLMNNPPQDLSAEFRFEVSPPEGVAQRSQRREPPTESKGIGTGKHRSVPEMVGGRNESGVSTNSVIPNPQTRGASGWDLRFMRLIMEKEESRSVFLVSFFLAMILGAFHALEPGHGKTLVAAYLVGSHGTAWHALLLGLIVTASHTAGVYLLGAATLYLSKYVLPEQLYPWMGLFSGIAIAAIGLIMFLRRVRGTSNHSHPHPHFGGGSEAVSNRQLLALGITGGLVPCPAALVVLLGAISLGRVGFGLLLIVAFSLGLATVLVFIGLVMVHAGRLMTGLREDYSRVVHWLPLISSSIIIILGVIMAVQGLVRSGILRT